MEWALLLQFLINTGAKLTTDLTKGLGDTFGNYMLHGIEEVQLPDAVSWWPQAIGWKILFALMCLWLGKRVYQAYRRWRRNHYRRNALRKLTQLQNDVVGSPQILRQLMVLLKATALQAYPRAEVAQLTGQAWLSMLDSKWNESTFSSAIGERLLLINYQSEERWHIDLAQTQELFETVGRWIKKHQSTERLIEHD